MKRPFDTNSILKRFRHSVRKSVRMHVEYRKLIPNKAPHRLVVEVPEADTPELVQRLRSRMFVERVVFAVLLTVVISGWCVTRFSDSKSLIMVDGKPLVCLSNQSDAERILNDIKSRSGVSPEKVQFSQDVVVARAPRGASPISRHKAMRIVERSVSPVVSLWAVIADGKPIVAVPDEETAAQVLEMAKLRYGSGVRNLAEEPQIREDVKVDVAAVHPSLFRKTAEQALDFIFSKTKAVPKDALYQVRSGDFAEGIAHDHSLTTRELRELNPGVNLNRLSIGDTLHVREIAPPKAKLTVVVRDLTEREEPTPIPTQRISSPRMKDGQTSVVSKGAPGLRKVRVATIYENGRKVGAELMEEQILREPVPRIIAVGVRN